MRAMVGSLVCAVVLMVWGTIFWTATPIPFAVMSRFPDEAALSQVLTEHGGNKKALYVSPMGMSDAAEEADDEQGKMPFAYLVYDPGGMNAQDPMIYVRGFVHYSIVALATSIALTMAAPALPSFGLRVYFVFVLAVLANVWIHFGNSVWWHFPWDYCLGMTGFNLAGGLLMGVVLAWFIPSRPLTQPDRN